MIIKSLSRKGGTEQIINYLFKDKEKLSNKDFKPLVIRHNIRSRNLDKVVKEFKVNETFRKVTRKDSVKIYHSIISFSKKDKENITDKMLRDFGKKYMELQGKDNMYLITAHFEKEHVHLHVAMSGSKYLTGIANRLSKNEFAKLKVAMQEYQKEKYPILNKSIVSHGKGNGYNKDIRQSQKARLQDDLQKVYQQSKSTTDFLKQVKSLGYEVYNRKDKPTGLIHDDLKYRFNRLGFDDKKMKVLDEQKSEEKQQLDELEDLRNSHSNAREQDVEVRERDLDDDNNNDNENELENEMEDDYSR